MLNDQQRDYLLPKAYNAALRAGAAIIDLYSQNGETAVTLKSDFTPITLADRRSHDLIKDYLGQTRIPVLSEEGRQMLYSERQGWDLFWMVDPLDGTKEFIKGNGEFTVNIALMVDNRPEIGVIYVPYINKIYFCDISMGAFRKTEVIPDIDAEYSLEDIMRGAEMLPDNENGNKPVKIAISRSHNTPETFAYIDKLKKVHPDAQVVEQGSSYKFCLLAEGAIDYYVRTSDTYEWDTAAGEVLLKVAGGSVCSLHNEGNLCYNKESLLNPHFLCRSKGVVENYG